MTIPFSGTDRSFFSHTAFETKHQELSLIPLSPLTLAFL